MKIRKSLSLLALLLPLASVLAGCDDNNNDKDSKKSDTADTTGETTTVDSNEKEMNAVKEFLKSLKLKYAYIFPFDFDFSEIQKIDNAKMAGENKIVCHGQSDIAKYANIFKDIGFTETKKTDSLVGLAIENKDRRLGLYIEIAYDSANDSLSFLFESTSDTATYKIEDFPHNFSIEYDVNWNPYKLYCVDGEFYFSDTMERRFYLKKSQEESQRNQLTVYRNTYDWSGWEKLETIEISDIYNYFVRSGSYFGEPLKLLSYSADRNFKYVPGCEYSFLGKSCKQYEGLLKIGGDNGFIEMLYTDASSNILLASDEVYQEKTMVCYRATKLKIGGVTMPIIKPTLDDKIEFPKEELANITRYEGFPAYEKTKNTWLYEYSGDAGERTYKVTVFGASEEDLNAYVSALENAGFTLSWENEIGNAKKKDLELNEVYNVSLHFKKGLKRDGAAGNTIEITYSAKKYNPSKWPENWSFNFKEATSDESYALPPFVTEEGEYTKTNKAPKREGWTRYPSDDLQITVSDYKESELSAWKEQLTQCDSAMMVDGCYYVESDEGRYLVDIVENSDKTLVAINIYRREYRLHFPTQRVKEYAPECPEIPAFSFENVQYKFEKYNVGNGFSVRIYENEVYLENERVAEMMSFLNKDDSFAFAEGNVLVAETASYNYRIYCNYRGFNVSQSPNKSQYYWNDLTIPSDSPVLQYFDRPNIKHPFEASYNYSGVDEKDISLNFQMAGMTKDEFETFTTLGTHLNLVKTEKTSDNSDRKIYEEVELLSEEEKDGVKTSIYAIKRMAIEYNPYSTITAVRARYQVQKKIS